MERRKGYSPNTVDQYSGHVARFIDFVYEASQVASKPEFSYVIDLYEEFLTFGLDSENPESVALAELLGKTNKTTYESISQGIEASIKLFLEYKVTTSAEPTVNDVFTKYYRDISLRTGREIVNIKKKSWLEGTIRDSLKRCLPKGNIQIFVASKARMRRTANTNALNKNNNKAFPLDKAVEYLTQKINGKRTVFLRNMSVFSLLAASGVRSSEVLQLRVADIDVNQRRIYIKSPYERDFKGLTPEEARALSWKGRVTEETFLIEPFATIFWDYFSKYIREVFRSNVNHDFVFQKSNGRPLFTWDTSNRNKVFKKYAKAIGFGDIRSLSPHSFRHMYGVYTLNYLPLDGGVTIGLPMAYVKILMGHQSISSTEKYAIQDIDLVSMYIELANKYAKNSTLNIKVLKERLIDRHVSKLLSMKGDGNV